MAGDGISLFNPFKTILTIDVTTFLTLFIIILTLFNGQQMPVLLC